jgi:hypothetical protein
MLSYARSSRASQESLWRLVSRPSEWHRWAPHVRGARGLGEPEVEAGRSGSVLLFPRVPVSARITAKEPGQSWTWRVGLLEMRHVVEPRARGSEIRIEIESTRPVEMLVRGTYGPLIGLLLRNLARVSS